MAQHTYAPGSLTSITSPGPCVNANHTGEIGLTSDNSRQTEKFAPVLARFSTSPPPSILTRRYGDAVALADAKGETEGMMRSVADPVADAKATPPTRGTL